jgi:hypothetical protein
MYAYCVNDPVNNVDPSGYWVVSLLGFTIYLGFNYVSIFWVFDGKGNQGLLISAGIGATYPQFGISYSPLFSWRKTIFDLQGLSKSIGGSGSVSGVSLGADLLSDANGPIGIQLNIGASTSSVNFQVSMCTSKLIAYKTKPSRSQINQIISFLKAELLQG